MPLTSRRRKLQRFSFVLASVLLTVATLVGQGPIRYVYDDVGRLIAVIDTNGDTATYTYDAVGNVLSITRYASTEVSIISFTPSSNSVGGTVTIAGTGFSTTANLNTVEFNGTAATVSSATSTQLVVTVPSGATTGTITVDTPSGDDESSSVFTVSSAVGAPTITGFSPSIVQSGSTLTVDGTNFDTNPSYDRLTANVGFIPVSSAAVDELTATIQGAATSGKVKVTTPRGSATSSADLFVAPTGYTTSQVDATDRMSIGSSQSFTVNTASKVGLLVFDGTAGQRVSATFSAGTITSGTAILYDALGKIARTTTLNSAGRFLDTVTLPATATYTLLIAPGSSPPATTSVTLNSVTDLTGTLTLGTGSQLTFTTPGQNARLTFSGTSGHRYSVTTVNGSPSPGNTTTAVVRPDTVSLMGLGTSGFIEPMTAGSTGTHVVTLDPNTKATGVATVTVYDVPDDDEDSMTAGTPTTVTTTAPGQNGLRTFTADADDKVSLQISGGPSGSVIVKNSAGTTVESQSIGAVTSLIEPFVLAGGNYSVLVDYLTSSTGSVTLTLHEVPADLSGTITPGGSQVTAELDVPGQNALYSLGTPTNARVSLRIGSSPNGTVYVLNSNGSTLTSKAVGTAVQFIEPWTFASGQSIKADPSIHNTGDVPLTAYDVPDDTTGTITIGAAATGITTAQPGQNHTRTFSGTSSQQVTVRVTSNTHGTVSVKLLSTNGTTVLASSSSSLSNFNLSQVTLPSTGTYTVSVDANTTNTGALNVQVTNP